MNADKAYTLDEESQELFGPTICFNGYPLIVVSQGFCGEEEEEAKQMALKILNFLNNKE